MRKYYPLKQTCSMLLLIFINPCYGQTDGYFFHSAIRDKVGNLWFATHGAGVYRYDAATGMRTNFTNRDGLCDNNVSSILEDKAGNLWFSTEHGVCRYDGKSFTDITTKVGLCIKYYVNCILEDRNGNFWFATNGYGVCRYNPVTGAVTNFTKEQGLGSNAVQCILEDKTGNIWFVNLYSGLCRYDGKSFTHITEENGLCNDTICCMYEDKNGNLWIGSDTKWNTGDGGVCRYDGKSLPTGQADFTRFSTKDGLANSDVWTIVEDNDGNIWIGTRGGLFRYHSPSRRFINYTYKVNSQD